MMPYVTPAYTAGAGGHLEPAAARALLAAAEPDDAVTLGGCAVYALDSTLAAHPEATTLADRGQVYSTCAATAVVGHQYSWLGRLVSRTPAWFAPRAVERIPTASTPTATAAAQVARFVATVLSGLSVIVADSRYAKVAFLAALVGLTHVCGLVRLASNRVLYGAPPPADWLRFSGHLGRNERIERCRGLVWLECDHIHDLPGRQRILAGPACTGQCNFPGSGMTKVILASLNRGELDIQLAPGEEAAGGAYGRRQQHYHRFSSRRRTAPVEAACPRCAPLAGRCRIR